MTFFIWKIFKKATRNGMLDVVKCLVENGSKITDFDFNEDEGWSVVHIGNLRLII
jgi:hypothetical protein